MSEFNTSNHVQLDSVLSSLGTGWHQAVTMAMLALVYATNSMYNVNYVFAVEDINYRCKIPECEDSNTTFLSPWVDVMTLGDSLKECRRPTTLTGCLARNTNITIECTEWVYEDPHSFVAEFNLACDDWKQTLVGTVHSFGNMMGLLIQGQISDRFGRKTATVFAGTMGAVLGIAKSFSSSFSIYIILEGLEAAIGDALSPMFMLSIEIVEKKRAVLYQMILLNCYTCGLIVMPFIAWAVPYWRNFLRVIYAPTLLILTYSFFLDESIRWLLSKGKRERALKIIEKIARRNGVKLDKALLSKLDYVDEDKGGLSDRRLLLKTFRSRIMMQRFLVCMVWWFTITLINYGMMISSVFIDGNKYINFALLMLMDIPANVFYWLALSKYKRKMPLLISFLIGGVLCIAQPFIPKGYAWASLTMFMVFEMLATFSYNIVYMYTSELFPTYTRNSIHSICSAVGRVGSLVAPQTPLLQSDYTYPFGKRSPVQIEYQVAINNYTSLLDTIMPTCFFLIVLPRTWLKEPRIIKKSPMFSKMSYWTGLPRLIFGLTSLAAGSLTLFIPETAGVELPDTVEQAESIGVKKQEYLMQQMTLLGNVENEMKPK